MSTVLPARQRRPIVLVFALLSTVVLLVCLYLQFVHGGYLWNVASFFFNSVLFWYVYLYVGLPKTYAEIQEEKKATGHPG